MPVEKFNNYAPEIAETAFIHPSAVIIGNVKIEDEVSIWPLVVLRGDVDMIKIGRRSNVQDLCVFHPNKNKPVIIGQGVTVGHGAVVHGSVIGNNCLIAMGAIILTGAEIGNECIIGAGALVPEGKKIPDRSVVVGIPGKVVRNVEEKDLMRIKSTIDTYRNLTKLYLK